MSKTDKHKQEQPTQDFHAYADDATVLGVGDMEVENGSDRVTLTGDMVLTKDKRGLLLARQMQQVLNSVVQALEADKHLPDAVEVKPATTVKDPFA